MVREPEEKMPSLCKVAGSNCRILDLHTLASPGTYSPARSLVRSVVAEAVAIRFSANQGSPYNSLRFDWRN